MKLATLAALTFLSTTAFASEYQNWFGSAANIECKSTFERKERIIVKTTNLVTAFDTQEGFEYIAKHEVYSQVQLPGMEAKRKYTISKVMVDAFGDNEAQGVVLRPTIISGKHAKTGEKIKIEVDANDYSMEYSPATLTIGNKVQDYLKLECRIIFAG